MGVSEGEIEIKQKEDTHMRAFSYVDDDESRLLCKATMTVMLTGRHQQSSLLTRALARARQSMVMNRNYILYSIG